MPVEVRVPHDGTGDAIEYRTTRFGYDQVGNRTKVFTPRSVAAGSQDAFVAETVYDELNRVAEERTPFDPADARYNTADVTTYEYDAVGRLSALSAPPSEGQSVRNDETFEYFDNGWTRSSTDPWGIATSYDYNELGQQTSRTLASAGGSSARTMGWGYYPDGKLASRSDDGVPAGLEVVLADNSDFNNATPTGAWLWGAVGSTTTTAAPIKTTTTEGTTTTEATTTTTTTERPRIEAPMLVSMQLDLVKDKFAPDAGVKVGEVIDLSPELIGGSHRRTIIWPPNWRTIAQCSAPAIRCLTAVKSLSVSSSTAR